MVRFVCLFVHAQEEPAREPGGRYNGGTARWNGQRGVVAADIIAIDPLCTVGVKYWVQRDQVGFFADPPKSAGLPCSSLETLLLLCRKLQRQIQ